MKYWLRLFSTSADGTLSASEDSLIVSILSAGTFFGALTASPFGDLLGRRLGLIVATGLVFNFGVILQAASTSQPLFIAGRFFAGFGVGLVSALSEYPLSLLPQALELHCRFSPNHFWGSTWRHLLGLERKLTTI
jgi:MFS family permease